MHQHKCRKIDLCLRMAERNLYSTKKHTANKLILLMLRLIHQQPKQHNNHSDKNKIKNKNDDDNHHHTKLG